jgi:hypothetical protein
LHASHCDRHRCCRKHAHGDEPMKQFRIGWVMISPVRFLLATAHTQPMPNARQIFNRLEKS